MIKVLFRAALVFGFLYFFAMPEETAPVVAKERAEGSMTMGQAHREMFGK